MFKIKSSHLIAIATMAFIFGINPSIFAQTTNVIPPNIYLTDDGQVFSYKPGKRFVDIKKVKAAESSPESCPANQDPEGHWGQMTNGFQLSLRFDKPVFTNGEMVVGTLLLRNITNVPVKFMRLSISHQPSPINILAFKNQKQLQRKDDAGEIEVISANEVTIYPQTQLKYTVKLNDYYDFTGGGEFSFQANCGRQSEITSQNVPIQIK